MKPNEQQKLLRMLAAFEADLPAHELGYWKIDLQPNATTVENEDPPHVSRQMVLGNGVGFRVLGEAQCVRCRQRYEIPRIGNFAWSHDDPDGDHAARLISSAKEWVERIAERDGPCWGDVPQVSPENEGYAVLD